MLRHHQDENGAPGQPDRIQPSATDAPLATGIPGAEPPLESDGARVRAREKHAAGLPSIYETAHHGFGQMGVARSVRTLARLNQKDGFDCPSCV